MELAPRVLALVVCAASAAFASPAAGSQDRADFPLRPGDILPPSSPFIGPPPYLDVLYGGDAGQNHLGNNLLDLWLPENVPPKKLVPLLVFIHGGGFLAGRKEAAYVSNLVPLFLEAGVAVATINYRFSSQLPFIRGSDNPHLISILDSARALQFLRFFAPTLGIDPSQVALTGTSAGAGISLWLAFHDDLARPGSPDPIERQSTRIACIGPYQGQTTYDPREVKGIFPGTDVYLDRHLVAIYGLTPEQYRRHQDELNERFDASFRDTTPLTDLDSADSSVDVFMHYDLPFGQPDIHSPEFARYAIFGKPPVEGFEHETFESLGMNYLFEIGDDQDEANVHLRDFLLANCLQPFSAPDAE